MNFLSSSFFSDFNEQFYTTFIKENRWKLFTEGAINTIQIAFFATLLGVLIGIFIAIIKVQDAKTKKLTFSDGLINFFGTFVLKILNTICDIYITVVRGTPVLVQLMIIYFIIFSEVDNAMPIAILAFGVNSGAYVAEIVRAGILAVDRGQNEAGRSLGLTYGMTMKKIILPQAIKNILPALGNEFIALLKETSVAGYIGINELTKAADRVRGITYDAYFPLLSAALFYLLLVIGLSALMKLFERRLAKSDRS